MNTEMKVETERDRFSKEEAVRFAERNRMNTLSQAEQENNSEINYTWLGSSDRLTVQGFSYVGRIVCGKDPSDGIHLEAKESVDVSSGEATYSVQVVMSNNSKRYYSHVTFCEIGELLDAIRAMKTKSVGPSVTRFSSFQVDWVGSCGFSIAVFSDREGTTRGAITSSGTSLFLHTLQVFDELEKLFLKAKSFIDGHLQSVGKVAFYTSAEGKRTLRGVVSGVTELRRTYSPDAPPPVSE